MNEFNEKAYYLLVWRAILAALIAAVLMVTRTVEFAAALLVGANIALLFSVGLIVWISQLDEEQIVRTEGLHGHDLQRQATDNEARADPNVGVSDCQ